MRPALLVLALAFVAIAPSARANPVWLGAQLAFPVPAHDVSGNQLGVDAGATLNMAEVGHVGVGLDIVYHYFPAGAGYKAGLDRYLYLRRLVAIEGPNYAFKAIQVTPHFRVTAPLGGHWASWIQIGGGAYFIDRNLGPTDWTGSYFYFTGPGPKKYTLQPGWNAGVGIDARPGSNITVGVDATYHQIPSVTEKGIFDSDAMVPTFNAITAGVHVLYGW